jgi:hypothetical protein
MNTFDRSFNSPLIESLEDRQLLSVAAPTGASARVARPMPVIRVTALRPILTGTAIHAQADQPFRAVIGTIRGLGTLPTGYTLQGKIDWGDGTPASDAQFVRQFVSPASTTTAGPIAPVASVIDVLGAHTYSAAGGDEIRVVVMAVPPKGSEAPVRLIGTFQSKAEVIKPDGGVTINATAGVSFTARLGFFHTTLSDSTLRAVIDWDDGTQSPGKIVPLPTAGVVPSYAVEGAHTYATTASHLVHITVYSSYPPPILTPTAPPTTAAPVVLVAQIDSVIDVLPRFRYEIL